jgi:hypothetical protein
VANFGTVAVHCLPKDEDKEHALVAMLAEKKGAKPQKLSLAFAIKIKSDPTLPVQMLLCMAEPPLSDAGGVVELKECPVTTEPLLVTAASHLPLLRVCFFNRDDQAIEAQSISVDLLSVKLQQKRLNHSLPVRALGTDAYSFGIGGDDSASIPGSFKLGPASITAKYTGRNASASAKGKGKGMDGFGAGCVSDVTIVRGTASKLVPRHAGVQQSVNNADDAESRTIIRSVVLAVTDAHGNSVVDWVSDNLSCAV